MTEHYHANAEIDLEGLEQRCQSNPHLLISAEVLALIQRLREAEAQNKRLMATLRINAWRRGE